MAESRTILTSRNLPGANRLIYTGTQDGSTVGAESNGADPVLVAPETVQFASAGRVPKSYHLIAAAGGEIFAVGAEGHRADRTGMPGKEGRLPAGIRNVPHRDRWIFSASRQQSAVGTKSEPA